MAKIDELIKRKEELEKKIKLFKAKESVEERKKRGRKLIELGSFFFGLDYDQVHKLIIDKANPALVAIELQKKIATFLKDKKIVAPKENQPDNTKTSVID